MQKQDLADLFELFDTDGGGTLDADEIKIALLTLGYLNTTEEEETTRIPLVSVASAEHEMFGTSLTSWRIWKQVEEYVRHLDTENKDGLSLEQFVTLITEKQVSHARLVASCGADPNPKNWQA